MSCSITKVLDAEENKKIDDGVDIMAAKISAAIKLDDVNNADCRASDIDRYVNIVNMAIQYIILSFVVLAVIQHENAALIVNVIKWVSYVSLLLIAVQYRNVLVSAGGLFLYGLDLENQIIIVFSICIALITGFIQKGTAGMKLTIAVAVLIVIRLAIQMKNFLLDRDSKIPAFLVFVKELLTPSRITKIYKAF
jgi:hypothetical protein